MILPGWRRSFSTTEARLAAETHPGKRQTLQNAIARMRHTYRRYPRLNQPCPTRHSREDRLSWEAAFRRTDRHRQRAHRERLYSQPAPGSSGLYRGYWFLPVAAVHARMVLLPSGSCCSCGWLPGVSIRSSLGMARLGGKADLHLEAGTSALWKIWFSGSRCRLGQREDGSAKTLPPPFDGWQIGTQVRVQRTRLL